MALFQSLVHVFVRHWLPSAREGEGGEGWQCSESPEIRVIGRVTYIPDSALLQYRKYSGFVLMY